MVKYVKFRLEDKVHLEFRKMCLETGTTMQQRLTDLVEKDIQRHKSPNLNSKNTPDSENDTNGSWSNEDEGDAEINGHHIQQQVKIIKPRKNHKAYKDKVGELLAELSGNQVKVSFDGEEKAFYSDEIEIVG